METDRLLFEKFTMEDIDAIYKLAGDPAVAGPGGWPAFESTDDAVYMYENVLMKPVSFSVRLKGLMNGSGSFSEGSELTENMLIGAVMIRQGKASTLDIGDDEGEISFWIGRPYQGNGFGHEAVTMAVDHAIMKLGFKKIWAAYFDGNDASAVLLKSCGFKYEYTMEDLWWLPTNDIRTEHIMSIDSPVKQ